jgi:exodeoxyribonuclease V alpha subunit
VLSQDGLVYLHRYWQAERRVERHLCELATDEAVLGEGLPAGMFDDEGQAEAARRALGGRLCLISGGPGTGKTTTVARILALLYQAEPGLEVALAAPTGKAAETLGKRVAEEADGLVAAGLIDADLRKRFPDPAAASTLHRLLGFSPRGMLRPKYRDKRSLAFGVVIVDEASMVDLLLMDALLAALPPQGRLILLGDKDQLTSVEAGSVFGDLCGWSQEEGSPLGGSMCILTRNYRFDEITRSPCANMVWDSSQLFVDGSITAVSAVVPKPTAVRLLLVGLMLWATVGYRCKGLSA